jgi:energy-converting hydrogenase Eha subunit F
MWQSDSEIYAVVFIFSFGVGLLLGVVAGVKIQRSDIYSRCINENKTMIYEEVHKLCTERSR